MHFFDDNFNYRLELCISSLAYLDTLYYLEEITSNNTYEVIETDILKGLYLEYLDQMIEVLGLPVNSLQDYMHVVIAEVLLVEYNWKGNLRYKCLPTDINNVSKVLISKNGIVCINRGYYSLFDDLRSTIEADHLIIRMMKKCEYYIPHKYKRLFGVFTQIISNNIHKIANMVLVEYEANMATYFKLRDRVIPLSQTEVDPVVFVDQTVDINTYLYNVFFDNLVNSPFKKQSFVVFLKIYSSYYPERVAHITLLLKELIIQNGWKFFYQSNFSTSGRKNLSKFLSKSTILMGITLIEKLFWPRSEMQLV